MIKDSFLKVILIPLLGIIIPLYSGLVAVGRYDINTIIFSVVYFMIISCLVWNGNMHIIATLRNYRPISRSIFTKLWMLCIATATCSAVIISAAALLWQQLFNNTFFLPPVWKCSGLYAAVALFITPFYESVFLSKERELDSKIVDQLDSERISAEISSLQKEMDPHFMFNSLTTLSHLIHIDPDKAYLFNNKLAQVYKYFLINRDRELVSIHNELAFIEDYFYLLQIRHDDKLQLHINGNGSMDGKSMIVPYALQVLVENAIKHNEFSDNQPLQVSITVSNEFIKVANNIRPKPYMVHSTHVGLKNLSSRYKVICNKDIVIDKKSSQFVVRLPLINPKINTI